MYKLSLRYDCPVDRLGAYWGGVRKCGRIWLTRLPEVLADGCVLQHTTTDEVLAPDIDDNGATYRCVSVAGSQYSDKGWSRTPGDCYVWYQLNYAPLSDLATTTPRAALARVRVHDAAPASVAADPANRAAVLQDAWLIEDGSSGAYYWDTARKLANYWSDGTPAYQTCVGESHFALIERRISGGTEIRATYWIANTAAPVITTWDNHEVEQGTTPLPIIFDPHAFPFCLLSAVTNSTTFGDSTLASIERELKPGKAVLPGMTRDISDVELKDTTGRRSFIRTISRATDQAPAITTDLAAVYVHNFAAFGAYVGPDETFFLPFSFAMPGELQQESAYDLGGSWIFKCVADVVDNTRQNLSAELVDGQPVPPMVSGLFGSHVEQEAYFGTQLIGPDADNDGDLVTAADDVTSGAVATVERLFGFPGNARYGQQNITWTYTPPSGQAGSLGPLAYYSSAGDFWRVDTIIVSDQKPRLTFKTLTNNSIDANTAAPISPSADTIRVLPAGYNHDGSESGVGTPAPRKTMAMLHNWPLSISIDDTTETDAVDVGQYAGAAAKCVAVADWNLAAYGSASGDTRFWHYWCWIDGAIYPFVQLDSDGDWEPGTPPMGEYWESGTRKTADTLCWDATPDDLHPPASVWTV